LIGQRWADAASSLGHEVLGVLFAAYVWLVRRTNRFIVEPSELDESLSGQTPVIVAMWHGQHMMISYAWPKAIDRMGALISRHADAGAQAVALRWLGVIPVRGSGGRADKSREKGGAPAAIALKRLLDQGVSIAMTADVPKTPRVAGLGIVTLARISGRPIAPTAVTTSRRLDFDSWDKASIGMPFGRGAIVVGELIHVPPDADDAMMEALRRKVEEGLDETHRRAYALVGARDPGAGLREA
jgi:lysophospholipid acyltransferase (LPLAT)-like uncharacterized protein